MNQWIDEVLAPDVATAPAGIVPILFLDSFSVHLKGSIVRKIQDLGVQVEFIPPGCTGLLQPVDVGFNKAFKAKMRTEYNAWLLEGDDAMVGDDPDDERYPDEQDSNESFDSESTSADYTNAELGLPDSSSSDDTDDDAAGDDDEGMV